MPGGAERQRRILPFLRSKRGTRSTATQGVHTNRTTTPTETPRPPSRETTAGESPFMRQKCDDTPPLSGTKGARAKRAGYARGSGAAAANPPLFAEQKGDAERSDAGGSYKPHNNPNRNDSPAISRNDRRGLPFHASKMRRQTPLSGTKGARAKRAGYARGSGAAAANPPLFDEAKGGRGAAATQGVRYSPNIAESAMQPPHSPPLQQRGPTINPPLSKGRLRGVLQGMPADAQAIESPHANLPPHRELRQGTRRHHPVRRVRQRTQHPQGVPRLPIRILLQPIAKTSDSYPS